MLISYHRQHMKTESVCVYESAVSENAVNILAYARSNGAIKPKIKHILKAEAVSGPFASSKRVANKSVPCISQTRVMTFWLSPLWIYLSSLGFARLTMTIDLYVNELYLLSDFQGRESSNRIHRE